MKGKLLHPLVSALLVSSVLLLLGGLIKWFAIGNTHISDVVIGVFEEELRGRQTTAVMMGLFGIITALLTAFFHNRLLPLLTLAFGIIGFAMIYNQMPSDNEKKLYEVSVLFGYWLSLFAAAAMAVISAACIFRLRSKRDKVV